MDWDFGDSPNETGTETSNGDMKEKEGNTTNLDEGVLDNGDKSDLDGDTEHNSGQPTNEPKDDNKEKPEDDNKKDELVEGTTIEFDGSVYTVDKDGNLLDKEGNIFKEASEVEDWMKGFDHLEGNDDKADFNIKNIIKSVGIEITGDDEKPIEFENSIEGVKSYIEAVNEANREDNFNTALNTLYQNYPIVKDVLDYYIANGNSLEGFNEIVDRSGITIDDANEVQQENIIRTAWSEQNRKGDVESYIQYLKTSGTLLSTAKEELEGLQEADKQYREELEAEAERRENEHIQQLEEYWDGVHDVIKSRKIAGYEIPENIIINRNGQKLSVSNEDFYNYIYRVDQEGKSQYERDLENESIESRRDDSILRAYLKFTGGNYSNLVNMAINKEKVANIRLRARERNKPSIKINRPANTNKKETDFGY